MKVSNFTNKHIKKKYFKILECDMIKNETVSPPGITGGVLATIGEFPHMVNSLLYFIILNSHYLDGVLFSIILKYYIKILSFTIRFHRFPSYPG